MNYDNVGINYVRILSTETFFDMKHEVEIRMISFQRKSEVTTYFCHWRQLHQIFQILFNPTYQLNCHSTERQY